MHFSLGYCLGSQALKQNRGVLTRVYMITKKPCLLKLPNHLENITSVEASISASREYTPDVENRINADDNRICLRSLDESRWPAGVNCKQQSTTQAIASVPSTTSIHGTRQKNQ